MLLSIPQVLFPASINPKQRPARAGGTFRSYFGSRAAARAAVASLT